MVVTPGRRSYGRLLMRARRLSPRTAARDAWLVLAPHPDDETLGAGGLIAALAAAGGTVVVAFLTDGSGSHVGAPGWPPARVARVRRQEAGAALRVLGLAASPVALGWRDAAPHAPGTPDHDTTVRALVTLCRRHRVRRIAATWGHDPHCDHEAAARLAATVAARVRARHHHYCVWGWTRPDVDARAARLRVAAVPITAQRGPSRRALGCHRSQLGGRIAGAADRFVLPRPMRRLVDAPFALLLEDRHAS